MCCFTGNSIIKSYFSAKSLKTVQACEYEANEDLVRLASNSLCMSPLNLEMAVVEVC